MFKKCKRGMTVLLAAVMLLTTMLPLTASAASGVTMDLTDCHVSWDYTLTDEEGNTFSAAYGLKAADDIYFGKGFSPYLSKMHDYTAKRKGLTGSTLNGDDDNETAEKEKRPLGAGFARYQNLYEIRSFYQ